MERPKFKTLSEDHLWSVANNIDPIQLEKLRASTKEFQKMCRDPAFWKWKLDRDFPDFVPSEGMDLKGEYYRLYSSSIEDKINTLLERRENDQKKNTLADEIKKKMEERAKLKAEIDTMYQEIWSIDEKYDNKISSLDEIREKLKKRGKYKKFVAPEVKTVINPDIVNDALTKKIPFYGKLKKRIKSEFNFPLTDNMVILVKPEESYSPMLFVFINDDRYSMSLLPTLTESFIEYAKSLGISTEHLLEKYGLNPKDFKTDVGFKSYPSWEEFSEEEGSEEENSEEEGSEE